MLWLIDDRSSCSWILRFCSAVCARGSLVSMVFVVWVVGENFKEERCHHVIPVFHLFGPYR